MSGPTSVRRENEGRMKGDLQRTHQNGEQYGGKGQPKLIPVDIEVVECPVNYGDIVLRPEPRISNRETKCETKTTKTDSNFNAHVNDLNQK